MSAEVEPARRHTPVVVVPDDPGVLATARAVARAAGRHVTNGWRLPPSPWDVSPYDVVVSGSLAHDPQEDALVDAVVRGAGAIVAVASDVPHPVRLVDALRRITPVVDGRRCDVLRLDEEQITVLIELSRGSSMGDAARRAFLSVRTAHRRVAEAREVLAARSTNAAASEVADALRFWAP